MLKKETTVSKMEANQLINIVGIAKKANHLLLKTRSGKVTYLVSEGNPHIFENSKYKKIFEYLKDAENKLVEPLEFNVAINFITLEALKTHLNENELDNIYESMGTGIFMLINDLSNKYINLDPEQIADKYLSPSQIANFRDFYSKNYDLVIKSFKNGYSTIPLYDMLYNKKKFYGCQNNIGNYIKSHSDNDSMSIITNLLYTIIIEFENEICSINREDEIEDIYYMMIAIDRNLDKITPESIRYLNNYTIENIHSIISA